MNITIIGAGLAGLSCGIHLLNQGFRVQILEKNGRVGGRANRIEEAGFKIDMGPTLILMPEVLEGVFRDTGRNLSDYLKLKKLEPCYKIDFGDGKHFMMTTNKSEMLEQVERFVPGSKERFKKYQKDVEDKLEYSRRAFIERNFNSFTDMMDFNSIYSAMRIKPLGNAYDHVYRYFKNDYLAGALSCQALYLGQSPLKTPALYNLLAYLEFTYGIWYPEGGMHQIPLSLAKVFEEMGGEIRLNSEIESIHTENGKAAGVKLKDGGLILSDVVVSNRDLPASYYHMTNETSRPSTQNQKIDKWNYGCSAFMMYFGVKKKIDGLFHHTILVNPEFKTSLNQIFNEHVLPDDPLIYMCSPTKTDETIAPEGHEIVYTLSLVPNVTGKPNWSKDIPSFRKKVLARLAKSGVKINEEDIVLEKHFSPRDFESIYGTYRGTAFGLAPDFFQSAAFRPRIKSKDISGLYHVGMSTHPGGGIPMVLTCGRLAANQITKDYQAGELAGRCPVSA